MGSRQEPEKRMQPECNGNLKKNFLVLEAKKVQLMVEAKLVCFKHCDVAECACLVTEVGGFWVSQIAILHGI